MPFALKVACRLAAVATTCLAAGCGGNPESVTGMSAGQIADKAAADLESAPALTIDGSGLDDGQAVSLSLGFAGRNRCAGTVNLGSRGSLSVIMISGTAWMRPDASYWKSQGVSDGSLMSRTLAGKYLKSPSRSQTGAQVAGLCDLSRMASRLLPPQDLAKGAITTLSGQRVVTLTDKADDATLYVTDTAAPRLVKATSRLHRNAGQFTITYGIPKSITPPPASQSVDAARFGM